MESSQDEDSEPIPTVYVKQRRGSFLSQPGKVQTLIQNLEEHYAQEWEKKAKTKQQNKKPQGKKVTIPKNHSDKSVEEPRQELIKELKHHHKESSSMPSVVMSNELTPTTARKKTAAASHQFRGKAGTFLLQTQKEGFMNVKRNGTSRWRRLWVALTDTSLFCYRDITVIKSTLDVELKIFNLNTFLQIVFNQRNTSKICYPVEFSSSKKNSKQIHKISYYHFRRKVNIFIYFSVDS